MAWEDDGKRGAEDDSDRASKFGCNGNVGVPRGKSISKVETFEIGDRGEDLVRSSQVVPEFPNEGSVMPLRLWTLLDFDLVADVFEAVGELDPNMSLTEKEWRDRCFFFDMCDVVILLSSASWCSSMSTIWLLLMSRTPPSSISPCDGFDSIDLADTKMGRLFEIFRTGRMLSARLEPEVWRLRCWLTFERA